MLPLIQLLPFLSTAVMLVFTIFVLQRFAVRRRLNFLFWGIGLAMFGFSSFAEAYLSLVWSRWVFYGWYLFGAALNAAWIGHGTLYLLVRKPWVHIVTVVLVLGSIVAAIMMAQAVHNLDVASFSTAHPVSEQYGAHVLAAGETAPSWAKTTSKVVNGQTVTVQRGLLPLGSPVRLTTPFFNTYGLLTLVGGAIYSAFLFWRKRVLPNRVIGNVLIAAGALSIAFASTLTRLGIGQYLYVGELIAAVLMFWGFLAAARPQPEEVAVQERAVAVD